MLFTVVSMESLQTIKAILNNVISLRTLNVIQKRVCFQKPFSLKRNGSSASTSIFFTNKWSVKEWSSGMSYVISLFTQTSWQSVNTMQRSWVKGFLLLYPFNQFTREVWKTHLPLFKRVISCQWTKQYTWAERHNVWNALREHQPHCLMMHWLSLLEPTLG